MNAANHLPEQLRRARIVGDMEDEGYAFDNTLGGRGVELLVSSYSCWTRPKS